MKKDLLCMITGAAGGIVTKILGGWDSATITLLVFMGIDYISGLAVAGIFKTSNKTANGALQSTVGWKGLCKKGMTLLFVLIAHRLDLTLNTNYIRDAVVIAFTANELISIVENAGLMGIPIPKVITRAIEVLKTKTKKEET